VTATTDALLPDGVETTFAEIESTMARIAAGQHPPVAAARSLTASATATVVAVGPRGRLVEAVEALKAHAHAGGIRAILIAAGDRSTPGVRVTSCEIALDGLRTEFIDNAVAALRLPSLPALLWWRGGEPAQTEDLAPLADRLVLDAENPEPTWSRVEAIARQTPVSDLRWTALTRWRALMAHFFDMPGVPVAAQRFTRLVITGSDGPSARLFAGWLGASLKWRQVQVAIEQRPGAPIEAVTFGSDREELSLRRLPGSTCVEARARLEQRETSRTTSLGKQSLTDLVAEELRVRSHDVAFEAAVRFARVIA
jgi:glucose-6-phosphate dehydrogenase-like protein OpcA